MISFDYKKATGKTPCKLVVKCTDKELFDQIRENFSVENTGARFARRYSRFAPQRKYVITPTGNCELGLYWSTLKYLLLLLRLLKLVLIKKWLMILNLLFVIIKKRLLEKQ